jgi:hypothetical protein
VALHRRRGRLAGRTTASSGPRDRV